MLKCAVRQFSLLLLLAVLACSDDRSATAPTLPPIQILPNPVPTLQVGQTVSLLAVDRELDFLGVTWHSSQPSVARVDADGLVAALDSGTAWIHAVLLSDPRARDSVRVDVRPPLPPFERGLWPIRIDSMLIHNTAVPIDRTAVADTIDVVAAHDVPNGVKATAVQVLFNGQIRCGWLLQSSSGSHKCVIDTRTFSNGAATVRAQLLSDSTVIARATSSPLNVAN